ncbi:MAG: hypothetical protein ABH826_01895 [Patescibacteria group bacterium]
MKNIVVTTLLLVLLGAGCLDSSSRSDLNYRYDHTDDYDYGYEWAENEDIDNFDDCQDEFGSNNAEDGCNDYVRENSSGYKSFGEYDCTEDCSGHEAGYNWAENNGIEDMGDCTGNSDSFIEGCWQYVDENY